MRYICNECINSCTLIPNAYNQQLPDKCPFGPVKERYYPDLDDPVDCPKYIEYDKSDWKKLIE